ncbi:MAG: OmpA family protein [Methylococcaceae bacterium]
MMIKKTLFLLICLVGTNSLYSDVRTELYPSDKIIQFAPGKSSGSDLSDEEREKIKKLAEKHNQEKNSKIILNGFATIDGSREFNKRLSNERVNSVKDILMTYGISASSIETKSYGETGNSVSPIFSSVYGKVISGNLIQPTYYWNAWLEKTDDNISEVDIAPTYESETELKPGDNNDMFIDFSGIPYDEPGIQTQQANQKLIDKFKNQETITLELVVIPDPKIFDTEPKIIKNYEINLKKLRSFIKNPIPPKNVMEDLKDENSSHSYSFTKKPYAFKLKSKNIDSTKIGSIGISIWYNGKPVDELILSFCVKPDNGNECPRIVSVGKSAVFDAAVPDEKLLKIPNAALHILKFSDKQVYGVFSVNDKSSSTNDQPENLIDKYKIWSISEDYNEFLFSLKRNKDNFQKLTDLDNLEAVKNPDDDLKKILFPNKKDNPNVKNAEQAFIDFSKTNVIEEQMPFMDNPKRIFIRMLSDEENQSVHFPLGRLNYGDNEQSYLGFHFLIETSFPRQNYEITDKCINNIVPVMFPEIFTEGKTINEKLNTWLVHNQDTTGTIDTYELNLNDKKFPVTSNFDAFSTWIKTDNTYDSSFLVITSHHADGNMYFNEYSAQIVPNNMNLRFKEPSVFLMNGCNTSDKTPNGILDKFNTLGFDAGIVTENPISSDFAGDYLVCFYNVLKNAKGKTITVGKAFWDVQKCFYPANQLQNAKFRRRALGYILTGNSEVKICP